jgi:hypothetical protein
MSSPQSVIDTSFPVESIARDRVKEIILCISGGSFIAGFFVLEIVVIFFFELF